MALDLYQWKCSVDGDRAPLFRDKYYMTLASVDPLATKTMLRIRASKPNIGLTLDGVEICSISRQFATHAKKEKLPTPIDSLEMYKLQTRLPWDPDSFSTSGTGDVGGLVTELSKECSKNRLIMRHIQSLQRDLDYSPLQSPQGPKGKKETPIPREKASRHYKKKRSRRRRYKSTSESSSETSETSDSSSSSSSNKSSRHKPACTSTHYYSTSNKSGVNVPRKRPKARSY